MIQRRSHEKYDALIQSCQGLPPMLTIVVHPCDEASLSGALEAAAEKHIASPVAGNADILLVPDLEAGNMLVKELTFLTNADAAGIALGARVPIILTSRADTVRARLASCAVATRYIHARRVTAAGDSSVE